MMRDYSEQPLTDAEIRYLSDGAWPGSLGGEWPDLSTDEYRALIQHLAGVAHDRDQEIIELVDRIDYLSNGADS